MSRTALATAVADVSARDPMLAALVARAGPIKHRPHDPDGRFGALVRSIVFQQLAGSAARAIHRRVRATVVALTPGSLAAVSDEALRSAGLSTNKLLALRDLSAKVLDGTVDLDRASRMSDEDLVASLTTVRGIGPWTAEMFLLFELRRLDVWPVGDLAIRNGYGLAWELERAPTAKELEPLGDRFRPYRSVLARYCWAAVHLSRGEADQVQTAPLE
jgi:3-methyladenine DNA glycosylase/8-oxoguanine DNA glycosylase